MSTEVGTLSKTPSWAHRLPDGDVRTDLADALRAYHRQAIEPHLGTIRTALDGDRAIRTRAMLSGGVDELLDSFRPVLRWRAPVLEADYPVDHDIHLNGRGLLLIPSYFCWDRPVTLADPELPPVLVYPVPRTAVTGSPRRAPVSALLGATRAAILAATASGFTTGEIARVAGVSAATASHHLNVLRDCELITSHRQAATVLHVLTPLGAELLGSANR
ncbi:ArsR/SmtB family transcription factor [Amycolatopsis sp. NPDC059657]|uniref:ArsR/SmtB family transcription factor n=1 Tax=Amycolatopsis sp. NPDC059657 TaxID=3346899 RepID=UPI00366EB8A5